MTGIIKTDQLQGAQSTTITIPTGNKISIADSATIGTLNATTMRGTTTFADSAVFSGTVSGDNNHLVKIFSSISSSDVSKVETDLITSTYDNYLLIGNIVATDGQNSSVDIYLRKDGSSLAATGNTGINVYQAELFNRAGDATAAGDRLNGDNAYLRIPAGMNIYGGSIMSFQVQFNVLYAGLVTGQTNLTSPINRTIRNGWYSYSFQSVSSSDYHGGHGWFRMDNPNQNINAVDGMKINSGASNFTKHNIALYGYVK
jgi:hypothetical protein